MSPERCDDPRKASTWYIVAIFSIVMCLGCGILVLALQLWISFSDIPYFRGMEMNVIFSVQKVLLGYPLYTDPGNRPFEITQYSPSYYLLCVELARLLGIAAEDGASITTLARLVSLAFGLIMIGMTYRLLTRDLRVRPSFAVAACAFILVATCPYLCAAKPNSLLSLCAVAFYYVIIRGCRNTMEMSTKSTVLASLLCLLAVLIKQNGIFLVMILLPYLFLMRSWNNLAIAGVLTALPLGVAALYLKSEVGSIVAANIVDGVDNGMEVEYAMLKPYKELLSGFQLMIPLAFVLAVHWIRRQASALERFLAICLTINFAFAALTAFKVGSSMSYFHNFMIAGAIASAYFMETSMVSVRSIQGVTLLNVTAAYLLWFLPYVSVYHLYDYGYSRTEMGSWVRPKTAFQFSSYHEVVTFLRERCSADPGAAVLSHELAINNLIPDRCVVPQQELARLAHERGLIDYSRLRSLVEHGGIRYVVCRNVYGGEQPPDFLGISFERFQRIKTFADHTVFEFVGTRSVPETRERMSEPGSVEGSNETADAHPGQSSGPPCETLTIIAARSTTKIWDNP